MKIEEVLDYIKNYGEQELYVVVGLARFELLATDELAMLYPNTADLLADSTNLLATYVEAQEYDFEFIWESGSIHAHEFWATGDFDDAYEFALTWLENEYRDNPDELLERFENGDY